MEGEIKMTGPKPDNRSFADRRPLDPDAGDEPDFAEEHTPSATDPPPIMTRFRIKAISPQPAD